MKKYLVPDKCIVCGREYTICHNRTYNKLGRKDIACDKNICPHKKHSEWCA